MDLDFNDRGHIDKKLRWGRNPTPAPLRSLRLPHPDFSAAISVTRADDRFPRIGFHEAPYFGYSTPLKSMVRRFPIRSTQHIERITPGACASSP